MGVVYQARDTSSDACVALKFLPQQWSHDEAAKQRFIREAQAASATEHPNICTIHDIETADDGQLFIVMAFYDGPTLKQRLESGPMAIDEALEIATQIADGLAKAHAQGVVHRDIKPGNIMVTEDGVRILDFGLATFVDALKLTAENVDVRDAGVHVAGTGARAGGRCAVGRLGRRRRALRDAGRARAVPGCVCRGDCARDSARSASAAARERGPMSRRRSSSSCFARCTRILRVRFESGRELARALRRVRGLTVPIELRTEPIHVPLRRSPARSRWTWRAAPA